MTASDAESALLARCSDAAGLCLKNADDIEHRATSALAGYIGGQAMLKLNLRDAVALAREAEGARV